MRPRRPIVGLSLILALVAVSVSTAAAEQFRNRPVATVEERTEHPSTPLPGSWERRAILDALRAELTHLTGPDLVFVVEHLAVRAGWAWVQASPQSRDGANRYEDVSALLRKQGCRWTVQHLGPCCETCDQDPGCTDGTVEFEWILERYPSVPPEIFPF